MSSSMDDSRGMGGRRGDDLSLNEWRLLALETFQRNSTPILNSVAVNKETCEAVEARVRAVEEAFAEDKRQRAATMYGALIAGVGSVVSIILALVHHP